MSDVPCSLTDVKVAIGKNIIRWALLDLMEDFDDEFDVEASVVGIPDERCVRAAEGWRERYPEVAKSATRIADRALPYLPDNRDALLISVMNDTLAATGVMRPHECVLFVYYVSPVLQGVLGTDVTKAARCLEALAAYGRGE